MAFVRLMCKAKKLEKLKKELEDEKMKSFEASRGKKAQYSIKQKYRHFWLDLKSNIGKWFGRKCTFPKNSWMYKTVYKIKHNGTCENFTLKSIIGFISGFFLTYIFFMFFVFILNFKLSTATIMCSFFGSILTIGLAFSYKVRCVVFLLLPQFFSKRGRQALMAYAFILAITGPAKNTLHNMGILSESLACGQEQLKAAVRQIIDVIKKPFYAIRDAIKTVVKTVKVIVKKIKEVLLTIKRIIMAILRVIKAAFQFLGKILNICNKELGTPFERCTRVFEDAIIDCHAKLGPMFSWLCSITYLVQAVCYIVKIFDFICMIIDFISDSVIGVVVRKVKTFVRHIRTMFYVRIKFSHSFHFETNQSKSMSDITAGIVTEMRHRSENILAVFDFMSCATSLFFLFIILRVLHYRYKFLTSERFDNRFITRDFRDIDMRRAQQEKETVLPLNHRERSLYITVTSIRLVKSEKVKLSKAAVVLGMTTLKLSTHMMADYALYWVLTVIRYNARFQSTVQAPNTVGLHIEGQGFIANLLKSIVKAFQPLGIKLEIDTVPCLPDPIPPDYDRYIQIASLLILCWILTIFEPYGLRLRHTVMCYYHPTRARQRAVWLYNHIMRSRSSFLKFARRQLRRKVTGAKGITKITFKEYLRANIKFKWFRLCLGSDKQDACLLCGEVFRESDPVKPIRCIKPGCPGIYCEQCYADLQNLCTVCMEPIQYGDLSDISEEKDSSADDAPTSEKKKQKKKKRCAISKCLKRNHDEDSDDEEGGLLLTNQSNLQKPEKSDSDYSSEVSTDNSYSYQNKKDLTREPQNKNSPKFSDVEKQRVSNDASWHSLTKQGHLSIASDFYVNRADLKEVIHKVEPDAENAVENGVNFSSTSHSSLLSELKSKNHGSQISELKLGKDSEKPLNIPDNKTNRTSEQKGDEKLSLMKRPFKTLYNDGQKVSNFVTLKKHTKISDMPYDDVTLKQQKYSKIAPQRIKNKNDQESDRKSISSEKSFSSDLSTDILKLSYENNSNNQEKADKYKIPYRDTGTDQHKNPTDFSRAPFSNSTNQQENVPLADRTNRPFLSESAYESSLLKTTKPCISSETETTFIETPKENIVFLSGTSSSIDSEIKKRQKSDNHQHIPPLNLNFDSSISSNSNTCACPLTVTDRFRENVKYETIQETPSTSLYITSSSTAETVLGSPRSPLNVNYQIYVPRYDAFLDRTDLVTITTGQKRNDNSSKEKKITKRISQYKHIQRQKRIEDIVKNKKLLQDCCQSNTALNENTENTFSVSTSSVDATVTKQINSCIQETNKVNKVHPNKSESKQDNTDTYKLKVRDYYQKINRKQPTDNPIVTKDQNKLVTFIKRIFRKAKKETEVSKSPKSKFLLEECDERFIIVPPKLTRGVSSVRDDSSSEIASTSTSEDKILNQRSTGTSTRSSTSSLMGSTQSHIRGGAESKLQNSEHSDITISEDSEITTSAITPSDRFATANTDRSRKNNSIGGCSDSEISDIDIFFGRKSSAQYRKRKVADKKESQTSESASENHKPSLLIDKDSQSSNFSIDRSTYETTDVTQNTNNKNSSIITAEESTPRYTKIGQDSRSSNFIVDRSTYKTKTDATQVNTNNKNSLIITAEESTPRYSRQPAERDRDPNFQEAQQIRASTSGTENPVSGNTDINKIMSDAYTSSEISPSHIGNVRGRCCKCSFESQQNTENMNENYSSLNQSPNSNTNRSHSLSCENIQGTYCTCAVKTQKNFNMETLHENYIYPNESPRLPSCYTNEATTERRPITNSPQQFRNKPRSLSEDRYKYSSPVRFCRTTEASAQVVRENNGLCHGPCRPPPAAVYCNCPGRPQTIDEIRGRSVEYSDGEPNKNYPIAKGSFPSNYAAYRRYPEDNQYSENYCACNTFEISSAPQSPRKAMGDDEISRCSGSSGRSQYPDLVYQNTDDFFELVNELGDILSLRNRERVKKTMREFEIKSSQNKNLDKPIIFESDSEEKCERHHHNCQKTCNYCLGKKRACQPSSTKFTRFETKRESVQCPNSPQRYGYVEKVVQHIDRNADNTIERQPKHNKKDCNARWELNTRTGDWYKVYEDDNNYENEYYNTFSPPAPRQICMCKRSPRQHHSINNTERQLGKYVSRSGKCNNCGFSRDSGY